HTCARKSDGTVWCWGRNAEGQLGIGNLTQKTTPVQVTSLGTSASQISSGIFHTCARKTDGTAWCWGYNANGQLGDGTMANRTAPVQVPVLGTGATDLSAGSSHTCARKTDGRLLCWGYGFFGALGTGSTLDTTTPIHTSEAVAQYVSATRHT